jgi:uncharacterized protein (TIGR03085 family)
MDETGPMTNYAQSERRSLCELFEEVGPDAATLCGDWTTRDLAAHLVIRERRPDAALGIIVPFAASYTEKVRRRTAGQPWDRLVELVRTGPPSLSPMGIGAVDRAVNTNEFFVHHEDVRRARTGWQPRDLDADLEAALWEVLRRFTKLSLRSAPCGVVVDTGDGHRITAKDAQPMVEVRGPVSELLLFTNGRQAHANVELAGPDDAVEQLRTASLGV